MNSHRFKTTWIADPQRRKEVWDLVRTELHELHDAAATETTPATPTSTSVEATSSATVPSGPTPISNPTDSVDPYVAELDLLVPLGQKEDSSDKTLLDLFISQPTTRSLKTLDSFPLIKKLFIRMNTLIPSSAPAEGSNIQISFLPLKVLFMGFMS